MREEIEAEVAAQVGRLVPGLAVVVVGAHGTVACCAVGLADLERRTPMDDAVACNWFSLTKLVTATAVMQLADDGRLDLDAPVANAYGPMARMRPRSRAHRITARHLLSHSAGLANPMPLRWVHPAAEPGPDQSRLVESLLARHRRVRFDPGTSASYSNLGYLVLGELICQVTGRSFSEQVRSHVLEPLGMRSTGFAAADPQRWATAYQRRSVSYRTIMRHLVPRWVIGPVHGDFVALNRFHVDGEAYGGLVGPASDAARFLRCHLRDGELDGTRLLSASSASAMRTIVARGRRLAVGLGWYQRGRAEGGCVEHLGGGAGFWSCMRLWPGRQLGIVMMGNATSYDHDAIAQAAIGARQRS